MKYVIGTFILVTSVLFILPLNVAAKIAPIDYVFIVSENGEPEYHFDLLVNEQYLQDDILSSSVTPQFSERFPRLIDSDLVSYNEDGWRSYLAYYPDANYNEFLVNNDFRVEMADNGHFETIELFKIVVYDEEGQIIHVTDPIRLSGSHSVIYYDLETHTFKIERSSSNGFQNFFTFVIAFIVVGGIRIVASVFLETGIAKWFKVKPLYPIIVLNCVTHGVLHMVYLSTGFTYTPIVIITELMVYIIEFLVVAYNYDFKQNALVLKYILLANTISVLLGVGYTVWVQSLFNI